MSGAALTCGSCGARNPSHARFCLECGRPLAPSVTRSRRAVTTIFCDLVSSTELGRRADAETAHHVLGRFYDTTRACVLQHGGTLEKFVGDAVMAVFGYPRLREDDALRAARAALDIQREVDGLSRELERDWGLPLRIRTGIATGEVMAGAAAPEEPFVIGSSVNLAARLEQAATPGQILVDDETASRIRRHAELRDLPPAELKGFEAGGVPVFELVAVRDGAGTARTALVDRRSDLRLLEEALRGVLEQRRCRVATVVGDAGVGKSRLLDELVAGTDGLAVVSGRCAPPGDASPVRPLAELVAHAVGASPDDPPNAIGDAARDRLADPDLAGRVVAMLAPERGADPIAERAATVRAVLTAVAQDAEGLVATLDDVHHASTEVLDVLEHLVEWTHDAPILLLCAARPELLVQHPTWTRLHAGVTLHLEPLGADDGAELASALLPEPDPALARRIAEVAGGNPFFIEEVVAALPADGDDVPVPPTVMSLLEARVDAVDPDERAVLERAAVLGVRFRLDELTALSGSDPTATLVGLAERDLVVRDADGGDPGWRFRNALIRDAAYQAVPKQVRAELHVAVADGTADDARAGFHLERAAATLRELGSRSPAVDELAARAGAVLATAGRGASTHGDVASAVTLLDRAVGLLPRDDARRPDALTDLQYALVYSGDIDRADRIVDELSALAEDEQDLVAVRARMQRAHLSFLRDPRASSPATYRAQLEAMIPRFEAAHEERDLAASLTDLALVSWVEGHGAAMVEAAERALEAAERCDDPRAVQEAAPLLATGLLLGPTPLDQVLERLSTLDAELPNDRVTRATLRLTEAQALALVGRTDDAEEALRRARATFEDLGQRRWLAASDETDAVLKLERGDVAGAIAGRRAEHAFFVEQGDALNARVVAAALADALVVAGELDEAEALLEPLETSDGGDPEVEVTSTAVRAAVAAGRGDVAMAERFAEAALRMADATDFVLLQAETRATLAGAGIDGDRLRGEAIERFDAKGATAAAARLRSA